MTYGQTTVRESQSRKPIKKVPEVEKPVKIKPGLLQSSVQEPIRWADHGCQPGYDDVVMGEKKEKWEQVDLDKLSDVVPKPR